jgi:hypothetical protein
MPENLYSLFMLVNLFFQMFGGRETMNRYVEAVFKLLMSRKNLIPKFLTYPRVSHYMVHLFDTFPRDL